MMMNDAWCAVTQGGFLQVERSPGYGLPDPDG